MDSVVRTIVDIGRGISHRIPGLEPISEIVKDIDVVKKYVKRGISRGFDAGRGNWNKRTAYGGTKRRKPKFIGSKKKYTPRFIGRGTVNFIDDLVRSNMSDSKDYIEPEYVDSLNGDLPYGYRRKMARRKYNKYKRKKHYSKKGSYAKNPKGKRPTVRQHNVSHIAGSVFNFNWPRMFYAKLKTHDNLLVDSATTDYGMQVALNDPVDPFMTHGANPMYEYARFISATGPFQKCFVYGGSYKIRFINFHATVPVLVRMWISQYNTGAPTIAESSIREGMHEVVCAAAGSESSSRTHHLVYHVKDFIHDKTLTALSATHDTSPSNRLYLYIAMRYLDGTTQFTNTKFGVYLNPYFQCCFHDRYNEKLIA